MAAQQTDVPGQVPTLGPGAPAPPQVVRRATQLCLRAEPHTDRSPCPTHLSEATRQLFRTGG
ncbi:MAG: hypothetical protein M3326_00915 [Actinomycetota bacterium]|nr:hypothetical protein [Actinomycetota bacterium]